MTAARPHLSLERPAPGRPRARRPEQHLIFAFTVRWLKWIARIPGASQIFDAMLLGATGLFHPARLRAISEVETEVSRSPGMQTGVHRLGGIGFSFQGKESGHIHGNGLLDCFVGRKNRDELVNAGRALPHHIFPSSGWISFWIQDEEDVRPALELIRIASERHTTG
jgi:hypothetical protein